MDVTLQDLTNDVSSSRKSGITYRSFWGSLLKHPALLQWTTHESLASLSAYQARTNSHSHAARIRVMTSRLGGIFLLPIPKQHGFNFKRFLLCSHREWVSECTAKHIWRNKEIFIARSCFCTLCLYIVTCIIEPQLYIDSVNLFSKSSFILYSIGAVFVWLDHYIDRATTKSVDNGHLMTQEPFIYRTGINYERQLLAYKA